MGSVGAILLWLLLAPGAVAKDNGGGEVARLTLEMEQLAVRNAWDGVERNYDEIVALGADPKAKAHVLAADAAHARGDIFSVIERLEAAQRGDAASDVDGRVQELRATYGRASLACKPGSVQLTPETASFRPDFVQAIAFAQAQLDDKGRFNGYLPAGGYVLGEQTFAARPHTSPEIVDLTVARTGKAMTAVVDEADLPKKAKVGGTKVWLNGGGVAVHNYGDLYVGALYLSEKTGNAEHAIRTPDAKRITLHMVRPVVPRQMLVEHLTSGLDGSQRTQLATMLEDLRAGDRVHLDWVPDRGVVVTVKDREKGAINDRAFMMQLWGMYLGDEAAEPRLRAGMLGEV